MPVRSVVGTLPVSAVRPRCRPMTAQQEEEEEGGRRRGIPEMVSPAVIPTDLPARYAGHKFIRCRRCISLWNWL